MTSLSFSCFIHKVQISTLQRYSRCAVMTAGVRKVIAVTAMVTVELVTVSVCLGSLGALGASFWPLSFMT